MFDMIDVIQMSKISKHYLLEYQTLLDSYEMQAPNVTSGFRVLDFSDDISDIEYTSDDWSVNESYSETSGEMTNSAQANILSNTPEYSVCAGSKPLSIIIRRCNTPTVVCSSPVPEIDKENSCTNSSTLPTVHCEVTDLFICQRENGNDESDKIVKCSIDEPRQIVNLCNKDKLSLGNEVSYAKSVSSSPENNISGAFRTEKCGAKDKHVENFPDTNIASPLLAVGAFSHVKEVCNDNVSNSFLCGEEEKKSVSDSTTETVADDSCFLNHEITGVEYSEYISHSEVSMMSSSNIDVDIGEVSKKIPCLRDEISQCIDVVSSDCNIMNFKIDNEHSNQTNDARQFIEVDNLTSTFCHENDVMTGKKNNDFENCLLESSGLCLDETLDTNLFEGVDRWRQLSCSPLLFSSDDESSSIADEVNKGIELALAPSPQYNIVLSTEKKKVATLQEMLMGAPPPPNVTMPTYSASYMLDCLKNSENWVVTNSGECSSCNVVKPWDQEAATLPWPQVKCLQYLGIHYNHGAVSEQFESLCQKMVTRYVGAETASSVTVWSSFSLPAPRKERRLLSSQRTGSGPPTGISPGRRLSHLARRHRTFSSASMLADGARLHSTLPHVAPERRTILVDGRKKDSKKSQKRSSQKKKNADRSADTYTVKLNSSKRALFQSPTDEEKKSSVPSKCRPSSASSVRSRRALFAESTDSQRKIPSTSTGETSTSRKRLRTDSEDDMCQQLQPRRLFGGAESNGRPTPSDVNSRQPELSSTHKKKLLWAVAEALKKHGVGFQHPQFRACAAALASTCRGHVQEVLALRQGSTSDRLLQLALRFVDDAVSQHIKSHSQTGNSRSSKTR